MWSANIQLMGKILFKSDVWNKLLLFGAYYKTSPNWRPDGVLGQN